jgi:YVTN family beta-propeller protein
MKKNPKMKKKPKMKKRKKPKKIVIEVYSDSNCGCADLNFELDPIGVGLYPKALATTQDGKHVYVVNQNNISVIDVATLAVITLNTGSYPMGIVMHPTKNKAYVACFGDKTIWVYDTINHTPMPPPINVRESNISISPASLAISSDGKQLLANSETWGAPGGLAWIDLSKSPPLTHIIEQPSQFISSIAGMYFPKNPYGAAYLDSDRFLASHHKLLSERNIRQLNTGSGYWGNYQINPLPCTILRRKDGSFVVTSYKTNGPSAEDPGIDIFRLDIAEVPFTHIRHIDVPSLARQIPPGSPIPYEGFGFSLRAAAIHPVNDKLWYSNTDDGMAYGHIGIVDLDTGQFQTFAFEDCNGIAFTHDGKYAFLSNTRKNEVVRVTIQ